MRGRPNGKLWAIVAAGVAVRLVVDAATKGLPYDIQSFEAVRAALNHAPLHVYSAVDPGVSFHWPYPPAFFPFVAVLGGVADLVGGFGHLIRLPTIAADGALTWLVWEGLRDRASERQRLLAAALVALGPSFILISGYAGQIDSVAMLPAVAALLVWERAPSNRRALIAGALIGLAAATKTVPLLMVLALLPSARSWREAVTLVGAAVLVLALALAPFFAADAAGVRHLSHYHGAPGLGGLSLVVQPGLAQAWLTKLVPYSGVTRWLFADHAGLVNGVALGAFALYALRFRPNPRIAAAMLWLVVLAFTSGFFFQYVIWGLPFFLLAGALRATALMQAALLVPSLLFYLGPWHSDAIVYVYVPLMLSIWIGWVAAIALTTRRRARRLALA